MRRLVLEGEKAGVKVRRLVLEGEKAGVRR